MLEAGIQLDEIDSMEAAFRKLLMGRVDGVLGVDLMGLEVMRKISPGNQGTLMLLDKPFLSIQGGPTFLTASGLGQRAFEDFKVGWQLITANGEALKILENYNGKGKVPAEVLIRY